MIEPHCRRGTGTTTGYDRYWQLHQVLTAMDQVDSFYTNGKGSQAVALVEKYVCPWCSRTHFRSKPDAVYDNNLDSLPCCTKLCKPEDLWLRQACELVPQHFSIPYSISY